jgi:hypothetical protein
VEKEAREEQEEDEESSLRKAEMLMMEALSVCSVDVANVSFESR